MTPMWCGNPGDLNRDIACKRAGYILRMVQSVNWVKDLEKQLAGIRGTDSQANFRRRNVTMALAREVHGTERLFVEWLAEMPECSHAEHERYTEAQAAEIYATL